MFVVFHGKKQAITFAASKYKIANLKKNIFIMKKAALYGALLSSFGLLSGGSLSAQDIQIEGAKFVHSIVEKWIVEYKKENPHAQINLKTAQGAEDRSGLLHVVFGAAPGEGGSGKVVYAGRYALIPVSNPSNPLLEKAGKGLKKKDLINLVFEKDILDEDFDADEKPKFAATVYTRESKSPTAIALACYFNRSPEKIKGKKVFGDEIYLLNAIRKDKTGVTFNTLNYVYDLQSRQLKSEISLLPLSLKSKQKEALESHDIDKVISLLEEVRIETIPVESFGLQIPAKYEDSQEVAHFIRWVLSQGQKFNHEYGFLTLDNKTAASQQAQLEKQPAKSGSKEGVQLASWAEAKR
jgi:ABC-type phosphate transport system substrate-binding protein